MSPLGVTVAHTSECPALMMMSNVTSVCYCRKSEQKIMAKMFWKKITGVKGTLKAAA